MDAIQGLIVFIVLGSLLCVFIPMLAYSIHLLLRRPPRRRLGGMLLGLALLLSVFLYQVMAAHPRFDYSSRCGPNGVGGCVSGQTPAQVRSAIRRDLLGAFLRWVGLPTLVGVGGVWFVLQRMDQATDGSETTQRTTS